ncbi:MAG TPA: permease [Candidatus Margulisbacteria bacterium]|nr:MAG: permease [Bacteroidetes bacterium GWF2_43_11]OGI11316.1 MAG: permease [Candidatus Margulisbacteria bacterium GWE2_39_32]HCT83687.1 permease [Candidatus Margulisiibacteriota bacterium]
MKKTAKRYRIFILLAVINLVILIVAAPIGLKSLQITFNNTIDMLTVIPPIFILLGLLDVWVEREVVIKLMGNNSGFIGAGLAFLLGSVAAAPLYAAFPIAGILLKKGCKFSNIIIFIGAWSTTKIPLLLFETTSMGWQFASIRFIADIFGIAAIAYLTEKILKDKEKASIYHNATLMNIT